ncbi:MAG: prefoldin subunit alpha [Nanoarchaeota archaeon]
MPKQKNKDLEQKYLELQVIIQQINQVQQQLSNIQDHVLELNNLKDSVSSLTEIKDNNESFVPVGFNIFTKAKLQNVDELLVNVGSNVFVIKSIDETNSLVNSQISQIELIIRELGDKLHELEQTGELIQNQIIEISNK